MNMKVLVLGYGRSGKAAEALLKSQGYEVEVWQDAVDGIGGEAARLLSPSFSFAVVSHGMALTLPWIAACRARGIPLKSELQLGCEELKRRGWKLLAVTGSKGKSSVVKIVADAINRAGGCAVACGNYGLPVSEVALLQPPTSPWAIVEVSSFMMETTELPVDTFEAATILNLQEDHLDRHGSVETYHALKRKLLRFAKEAVGDSVLRGKSAASPLLEPPPCPLHLLSHSYFDNPILRENGACAIALMRVAGLDEAAIAAAFRTFEPLPHRMNLIAEIDGVRYIDDSKATSLAALAAGVEMAGSPVHASSSLTLRLIAGGLPKGDDPKSVCSILTKQVRKVYLIGQSAEVFHAAWSAFVDCEICGTMERAVEAARRESVNGETVLLSPGTASFDQFKSFGERGDVFAELVKKGKTE